MSSEFFRDYNTQQFEAAMESFEQLKAFNAKTASLDIQFDYPKTYEEDYQKAVEIYCSKNYNQALELVNQRKYSQSLNYINRIKKYNALYKNLAQIEIISICEPLYQSAVNSIENKNYSSALTSLSRIREKTENYKDAGELLDLATQQQTKSFILFQPTSSTDKAEQDVQDYLFNTFGQVANQKLSSVKIINNTPFQTIAATNDLSSSNNVDLIQAIRKATGADYFYIYDVANIKEYNSGVAKTPARGFQEVTTKTGTVISKEYVGFDYNYAKAQRSYSYDYKYKLINAYTNQIVNSQTQNIAASDAIEYQEFQRNFNGNLNSLFPYNPQKTTAVLQYYPSKWRSAFSARSSLKSFDELKNDSYTKTVNLFMSSAESMK